MTTWPRDIPRPTRAPPGERGTRPALSLPFESRDARLRAAVVAGAEMVAEGRAAVVEAVAVGLRLALVLAEERDAAREEAAAAQAHAASALHALCVCAEQKVDAEARLAAARAALPALEAAAATGGRRDIAAALGAVREALGGHALDVPAADPRA